MKKLSPKTVEKRCGELEEKIMALLRKQAKVKLLCSHNGSIKPTTGSYKVCTVCGSAWKKQK